MNTPSSAPSGEAPLGEALLVPLRVLRYGHLPLIIYSFGLSFLTTVGAIAFYTFLRRILLQFFFLFEISEGFVRVVEQCAFGFTILFAFPLLVTWMVTPLPIIAGKGSLPLDTLVKLTYPSLQRAISTTYIVLRNLWWLFLIPVIVIAFYQNIIGKSPTKENITIFSALISVGAAILLLEVLPSLYAPILSICAMMPARDSLLSSKGIFKPLKIRYLIITTCSALACYGAFLLRLPPDAVAKVPLVLFGILAAIIWYCFGVVAGETIRRVDEINPDVYLKNGAS